MGLSFSFSEKLVAALAPADFQRMARLLRDGGFVPSGYFVDANNTIIEIDCSVGRMTEEADRLHLYLSQRVPAYVRACEGAQPDDEPFVGVQVRYDPADRCATIEIWGLRDALL